ncbi:tyrosine-type recombinase/integrase [Neobacillus niacini]|uniref:tyrosine-type recombinase/integrase n=1 Tax=Neobacillus niacini TaxID=86668 RepID=UPI002FFD97BA
MDICKQFGLYLNDEGKSENTQKSYLSNLQEYLRWFKESYDSTFQKLYRENVLEYKSYLLNVKKTKGKHLNGKTVNGKLSALVSFNHFLISDNIQQNIVINKSDFVKVQIDYANPCEIEKKDVEKFRQLILEAGDRRLYALVTLLAYGGLRISEALNVKLQDYSLEAKELIVRKGKGQKQRLVYLNGKIETAIREYLKLRNGDGEYLFVSRESEKVDRTVINKAFKKYSKVITPHMLRHFYATHCLEMGYSIHEVANQAGHRDIKTTLLYTNPSRNELKKKAELL